MPRNGRPSFRERRRLRREGRRPGPPSPYALLPWLLMGLGAFSNLFQGETPTPWIAGAGLLAFNSLYISVVFRGFAKEKRESPVTYVLLGALAAVTFALAIAYGGSWLLFFPLLSLAAGTVLRHRWLAAGLLGLAVAACAVAVWRDDSASPPWTLGYGTFISGAVTSAILRLAETVTELRSTRQELARAAVERERLRFSRDLHDLLGHTLSVIVVKSEAARRLAPRDMDAALTQVADIESVGRRGAHRDPRGRHRLPRGEPRHRAGPGQVRADRRRDRTGRPALRAAARPADRGAAGLGGAGGRHQRRAPLHGDALRVRGQRHR